MYDAFVALMDGLVYFWEFLTNNSLGSYIITFILFGAGAMIVRNIISD